MNIFKRENKPAGNADFIDFGGRRVEVPKLTIAKWKLLFDQIETLPQILLNVFASRNTADFTPAIVAALGLALDEVINLVAALTGLEPEWIEENVTHTELITFIERTVKKNDLQEAAKKFRAAFGKWATALSAAVNNQSSTTGSSNAQSSSE